MGYRAPYIDRSQIYTKSMLTTAIDSSIDKEPFGILRLVHKIGLIVMQVSCKDKRKIPIIDINPS